jgi:TPR repeat protein
VAFQWYEKAAEQGNTIGLWCLGQKYRDGDGVVADPAAAARCFRSAADQGDAIGQFCLGEMYRDGDGVAQSDTAWVSWCRKAAQQGLANAQLGLGEAYNDGMVDMDMAAEEEEECGGGGGEGGVDSGGGGGGAEGGAEGAWTAEARRLASAEQALAWFRLAAAQGHATAQFYLGEAHRNGSGYYYYYHYCVLDCVLFRVGYVLL